MNRLANRRWLMNALLVLIMLLILWSCSALRLGTASASALAFPIKLRSQIGADYGPDRLGRPISSLRFSIVEDALRDSGLPPEVAENRRSAFEESLTTPVATATLAPGSLPLAYTPTNTRVPTDTRPPSRTPFPATETAVGSVSPTASVTTSASVTVTITRTPTSTKKPSETSIPSKTPKEPSKTPTITKTPSITPSPTITPTPSNTPTPTITFTPSNTPTMTPSNTPTPTMTPTDTLTPTPTYTPTPIAPLVSLSLDPAPGALDQCDSITATIHVYDPPVSEGVSAGDVSVWIWSSENGWSGPLPVEGISEGWVGSAWEGYYRRADITLSGITYAQTVKIKGEAADLGGNTDSDQKTYWLSIACP